MTNSNQSSFFLVPQMNHGLKLYPPGSTNMQPTKEPVVAEVYDEAVFTDPKEFFFQSLMQVADLPKVQFADPAIQACFQSFSDEDDFQRLLEAQKFLTKELNQVKARMKSATMEMEQVDNELSQVHEAKKAAASGSRAQKHKTAPSAGNASKKSKSS
jgi:phage antirepressor YoqD-like protein